MVDVLGEQDLFVRPLDSRLGMSHISSAAITESEALLIVDIETALDGSDWQKAGRGVRSLRHAGPGGRSRWSSTTVNGPRGRTAVAQVPRLRRRRRGRQPRRLTALNSRRYDLLVTDATCPHERHR
jgi:hypothetical protein